MKGTDVKHALLPFLGYDWNVRVIVGRRVEERRVLVFSCGEIK